jgi:hypothetical protein
MKTIKARAPGTGAAAIRKAYNDKVEFKCDALAAAAFNSQCLRGEQHVE